MPVKKYSDYLEVNPLFESVVDIKADQRNPKLWQEYIVGDDMVKLVDCLCQSLGNEAPDLRRSFWVHGSYGTGKSYAAIFVKHLLEEKPQVVDSFMANHQLLAGYRSRFMKCRKNGDYLVIWKTGCTGIRSGNTMLLAIEKAVREALVARFGDRADLGTKSLFNAVKAKLDNDMINWQHVLENTTLGDDYSSVDELRRKVSAGDFMALQRTAEVIDQNGWGLVDNFEAFKAWIGEVIDANGLAKSGIFFIWDEFTEYIHHSDEHTILQQISEFCKEKPFFVLFVVHRSTDILGSMGTEGYQRIIERFHAAEFHISADASYDLIANSFNTRPNMAGYWADARKAVVMEIKPYLGEMEGLDDKISRSIEALCPMHPMTIKLLARVSESYAAAQRTLFRFMKDQSVPDQGFMGYINKYGPDDQAKWLTPEWLWDYFFTRDSDFNDKDTKAAEFIIHFEDNRHMAEKDENTMRVFKIAMLLLMVMSSTRGIYGNVRKQGGISATVDCLKSCLAGTMSEQMVDDKLEILEHDGLMNIDTHGNVARLQLPFKVGPEVGIIKRINDYDKKYTRYQMFAKDGTFSTALEKRALDENDPISRRIKVIACCAETLSINNRLAELEKELDKSPYKLGLLLVTVKDDTQALAVQADLEMRAREGGERLVIALVRTPLTDEKRREWLTRMAHRDLAMENGQSVSANKYNGEMEQIVTTWVNQVTDGSRITAWNGEQVFRNQYGMPQLRKTISINVLQELFPYAPETIVVTNTAYKPCNDPAPLVGITRQASTSQMKSVLNGLQSAGLLDAASLHELSQKGGAKGATSVAALAKLVEEQMATGKAVLSDLWERLQRKPFGYYDTIACGVLLGFVFSFYRNSVFSWTDSSQSTHVLGDGTLKTLVLNMCKGKMSTDYLSAGSVVFQKFRPYAKSIFDLSDGQAANETECLHNMRAAITKSGSPLWALKYLDEDKYINASYKETALKVVDALQHFVSDDRDRNNTMSEVLTLMNGRGKVRELLQNAFQDKHTLAAAFRRFLFDASPELKDIADSLKLQPEPLQDKLCGVMQGAIYSWTEEQVRAKLGAVAQEYIYLDTLNQVIGKKFFDIADARKELANIFKFFRLSMDAVDKLGLDWFEALKILRDVSKNGIAQTAPEEQARQIEVLRAYGVDAMSALRDAKPVLAEMLERREPDLSADELDAIYHGLSDMSYDTAIIQFEKTLKEQISKVSMARNRMKLLGKWTTLTGEETVKGWCVTHRAPIQWIVPKDYQKAILTVIDLQQGARVSDQQVQSALQALDTLDVGLMTDDGKIEDALIRVIGTEYAEFWQAERDKLISLARQKNGSDMSAWGPHELGAVQRMIKQALQEKAKKEKLAATKMTVQRMAEGTLRSRIAAFLDEHPEFCDSFME